MLIVAVLAGGATVVLAVVVYGAWLQALPRSVCPRCGEATLPVSSPATSLVRRWVLRRWCGACSWSGWGRNGPVHWRERGPVADGSGFRWGEDRVGADLGFRWGEPDRQEALPGSHPSGFRWRAFSR